MVTGIGGGMGKSYHSMAWEVSGCNILPGVQQLHGECHGGKGWEVEIKTVFLGKGNILSR